MFHGQQPPEPPPDTTAFYDKLGVAKDAAESEIKKACQSSAASP